MVRVSDVGERGVAEMSSPVQDVQWDTVFGA